MLSAFGTWGSFVPGSRVKTRVGVGVGGLGEGAPYPGPPGLAVLGWGLCGGCSLKDRVPQRLVSESGERAHRVPPPTPLASLAAQVQLVILGTPRPRRPGPRGGSPTPPTHPHALHPPSPTAWLGRDRMKCRNSSTTWRRRHPPPGPRRPRQPPVHARPRRPALPPAGLGQSRGRNGRSRGCSRAELRPPPEREPGSCARPPLQDWGRADAEARPSGDRKGGDPGGCLTPSPSPFPAPRPCCILGLPHQSSPYAQPPHAPHSISITRVELHPSALSLPFLLPAPYPA